MKSRSKLWIGYVLTVIILAGVLAVFVYIVTRDPYNSYATATVIEIDTTHHAGVKEPLPEDIFYEFGFTTADGAIVHFTQNKGLYTAKAYHIDDPVQINYNSADPQQAIIPDPSAKHDWIEAAAFGWLAISLFLVLVFYMIGKNRKKESS